MVYYSSAYLEFIGGAAKPINNDDIIRVAEDNGLNPAVIQACMDIESAGSGFNGDGSVKILFERHLFHRFTNGDYDASHPLISSASPGGYGAGGFHQYERLIEAIGCDREAALRAASWGKFQCLGDNHEMIGYADVEDMVKAFKDDEENHLNGFIAFCKATPCMVALKRNPPDFLTFARSYNGKGQQGYDTKMAAAYAKFLKNPIAPSEGNPRTDSGGPVKPPSPAYTKEDAVKMVQTGLAQLGLYHDTIDGKRGKNTNAALIAMSQGKY